MNAIILAAGLGSRFKEITQHTHKSLLPIGGVPNIERTISFLKEADIHEIYIVTGYLSEQFNFLSEKYGCHLIYNEKYREYNSIYSFYLASKHFHNSFIIDSDVVLFKNIFLTKPLQSSYFVINRPESADNEWIPILNESRCIQKIEIGNQKMPSLLGVSYWTEQACAQIKNRLNQYCLPEKLEQKSLYWDNIPLEMIHQLEVTTIELDLSDGYEMDTLEQYEFILKNFVGH